jgi:hypothetical protein
MSGLFRRVVVLDLDLRVVLMDGDVYGRHGFRAQSGVGRDVRDVIPALGWSNVGRHWQAALSGEARTLDSASVDRRRDYWLHFAPLHARDGELVGVLFGAFESLAFAGLSSRWPLPLQKGSFPAATGCTRARPRPVR